MKKTTLWILIPVILLGFGCSDDAIPTGGYKVTTIATPGGKPDGVAVAESGNIYVTDIDSGQILHIGNDGTVTQVSTLGGTAHPDGITAVSSGTTDTLYVTQTGSADPEGGSLSTDGLITQIVVDTTGVTPPSTTTFVDSTTLQSPSGIAVDNDGNLYVADQQLGDVYVIPVTGGTAGTPAALNGAPVLEKPHGVTLINNEDGSVTLYVTDPGTGSNNVVKIDVPTPGSAAGATVTEVTNDSTGGMDIGSTDQARFDKPHGIGANGNGAIFICDENNNRVQVITPSGNVNTIAGDGTAGTQDGTNAHFNQPRGLAIDAAGNLLICDYGNGSVRKITKE